jgi:hypothetical protein
METLIGYLIGIAAVGGAGDLVYRNITKDDDSSGGGSGSGSDGRDRGGDHVDHQ